MVALRLSEPALCSDSAKEVWEGEGEGMDVAGGAVSRPETWS